MRWSTSGLTLVEVMFTTCLRPILVVVILLSYTAVQLTLAPVLFMFVLCGSVPAIVLLWAYDALRRNLASTNATDTSVQAGSLDSAR